MIAAMADNDNGGVMPTFAPLKPTMQQLLIIDDEQGFRVVRIRIVEDLTHGRGFERVTIIGGPRVERGPRIDPDLDVETAGFMNAGYLDALERQRRRFRPNLSLVG